MGTPTHAWPHRTDSKMYRLQTPEVPLVQNANQGLYKMDEYPNGTNAIQKREKSVRFTLCFTLCCALRIVWCGVVLEGGV